MGMDLSAKVFYGFKLEADRGADEALRKATNDGAHHNWEGNKTGSPCVVDDVGWGVPEPVLGIRSTFVTARHGELAAFDFAQADQAWDEQLRAWCAENGFKAGVPSWQVGAEYV